MSNDTEAPAQQPGNDRKLAAQIAAHTSWANTEDRSKRTRNARAALEQKFLDEAGGDPLRAESLRNAYYKRLALKSAQSRRRPAEVRLLEAQVADWRDSIVKIEAQIEKAERRLAELKGAPDE